ncbi:MAG: PHP domain-containing protein [Armatimonadota bacterium]|nr:MAG: PHP domain-containing protein [Armatimonadota bacterium]
MRTMSRLLVLHGFICTAILAFAAGGSCAAAAADPMERLVAIEAASERGVTFTVLSPYRDYPNWYKGQMHCHTRNSDGGCLPPQLEAKYRADGADWITITDHEHVTPDPQAEGGQDVPVFITGEEHGTAEGHMVFIHAGEHIATGPGQEAINQATAAGGMAMLCHPDWLASYGPDELDRLTGFQFIEVVNAGTRDSGKGMGYGSAAWDYLLGQGKVVWGTATDDFHGGPQSALHGGYVVVNAPALTAPAILANLLAGNFYATEGPELHLSVQGGQLTVTCTEPQSVFFRGPGGAAYRVARLDGAEQNSATYVLRGDEPYVRVEIFRHADGRRAWSQPIFVRK